MFVKSLGPSNHIQSSNAGKILIRYEQIKRL